MRTTFLLSRSLSGGVPNGPSSNASISNDQRIARVAAYQSDATNIVAGDTNGFTDVFMVRRQAPWTTNGSPWSMSNAQLVSTGIGGAPANGPSYQPTVDGDSHDSPTCIGFISAASNLVPGDTNVVPDAFVKNINTGVITRVSVNSKGQQENGAASDITVDGDCERVAFTSTATNLSLKSASNLAWKSAQTSGSTGGKRQVYVRVINGKGLDKGFKGMTFLASANKRGKAGNGDSYQPSFARAGKSIVFTSTATNLDPGDHGSAADVYQRSFVRYFTHVKKKGVQALKLTTRLVSSTSSGQAGDGASMNPTSSDDGRWVSYQTDANNILPGDSNGVTDVVRADLKGKRAASNWVDKSIDGAANGASTDPVISNAGEFVLFDSDANNLRPSTDVQPDSNGVQDMFLWNAPTQHVSLESRDWDNGYLTEASSHPATSSRGNYVLFESADPNIDQLIQNLTGNSEVYLRYLGPK